MAKPHCRQGRRFTCTASLVYASSLTKKESLMSNLPISVHNRVLSYHWSNERLRWTARLSSSATASPMCIRSRYLSVLVSRHVNNDEVTENNRNNSYDDDEEEEEEEEEDDKENIIYWDEPDKPDESNALPA